MLSTILPTNRPLKQPALRKLAPPPRSSPIKPGRGLGRELQTKGTPKRRVLALAFAHTHTCPPCHTSTACSTATIYAASSFPSLDGAYVGIICATVTRPHCLTY